MTLEATIAQIVRDNVHLALENLGIIQSPGKALRVKQVAERLSLSADVVHRLLSTRELRGWRIHGDKGDWRVNEVDLHAFQRRRTEEA